MLLLVSSFATVQCKVQRCVCICFRFLLSLHPKSLLYWIPHFPRKITNLNLHTHVKTTNTLFSVEILNFLISESSKKDLLPPINLLFLSSPFSSSTSHSGQLFARVMKIRHFHKKSQSFRFRVRPKFVSYEP